MRLVESGGRGNPSFADMLLQGKSMGSGQSPSAGGKDKSDDRRNSGEGTRKEAQPKREAREQTAPLQSGQGAMTSNPAVLAWAPMLNISPALVRDANEVPDTPEDGAGESSSRPPMLLGGDRGLADSQSIAGLSNKAADDSNSAAVAPEEAPPVPSDSEDSSFASLPAIGLPGAASRGRAQISPSAAHPETASAHHETSSSSHGQSALEPSGQGVSATQVASAGSREQSGGAVSLHASQNTTKPIAPAFTGTAGNGVPAYNQTAPSGNTDATVQTASPGIHGTNTSNAGRADDDGVADAGISPKPRGRSDPFPSPGTPISGTAGPGSFSGVLNSTATSEPKAAQPATLAGGGSDTFSEQSKGDAIANHRAFAAPGIGSAAPELQSVTNARLMQSLSRSEMQVNMHSADFGRITIQSTYGRDAISAQISLEDSQLGSALRSALSAHIPEMEQKLGQDHGLRASVTIDTQSRGDSGTGKEQQADPESDHRYRSALGTNSPASPSTPPVQPSPGMTTTTATVDRSRLDVRI